MVGVKTFRTGRMMDTEGEYAVCKRVACVSDGQYEFGVRQLY